MKEMQKATIKSSQNYGNESTEHQVATFLIVFSSSLPEISGPQSFSRSQTQENTSRITKKYLFAHKTNFVTCWQKKYDKPEIWNVYKVYFIYN